MDERQQYLNHLIETARSGHEGALAELSSVALGGNRAAQSAILEMDKHPGLTIPPQGDAKSMVWPREVEEGKRGPRRGDVPLHNDL